MKNQALFSSKDLSKKFKCRLLQFLLGTLRVKSNMKFIPRYFFILSLYLYEPTGNSHKLKVIDLDARFR